MAVPAAVLGGATCHRRLSPALLNSLESLWVSRRNSSSRLLGRHACVPGRVAHGADASLLLSLAHSHGFFLLWEPDLALQAYLNPSSQNVQVLSNQPWFSPVLSVNESTKCCSQLLSPCSSPWVLPSSPPPLSPPGSTPPLSSGHVIYKTTSISGGYIPDSQIASSISVMNSDYASCGINFSLADTDRTLNPTWPSVQTGE